MESTPSINDAYKAVKLKTEAAELIRQSLPMRLLELKAAATAMTPETEYTKSIPSPYISAGMSNTLKGFGLLGGTALLAGLGYLGYQFNKQKMKANIADRLEQVGRLKDFIKSSAVQVEVYTYNTLTKQASAAKDEVREIMHKIYAEDPTYWPYGLGIEGHDSVYLIRDTMTKQAAGFIGWQVQNKAGRKIGSYSIGILPEFRNNGFAKEAVAKILQEKAASVDEVRSYICEHNKRSQKVANKLSIPIYTKF